MSSLKLHSTPSEVDFGKRTKTCPSLHFISFHYSLLQRATQSKGVVCSSGEISTVTCQYTQYYLMAVITRIMAFLGGNAGMAAAYVARKMGLPATIVVPSSTPQLVVQRLKDQGATVKIVGKVEFFFFFFSSLYLLQGFNRENKPESSS